ncbi:MAG: GGDEF domain-containing protein [Idiomarina sp.]|nr:GGDEF domain-containing protein [Idiomarina sp.]
MTVEQQQDRNGVQILACTETFQSRGRLAEQLQTTLDVEQLLALYGREVREQLQVDSLTFAGEGMVFAVFGYPEQQPQHTAALFADGEYLGQLVYSKAKGFSAADLRRLNNFHQQIVFPLRNAMRFARVRQQAMHDHMTGVGNRLLMEEAISRASATAKRNQLNYMVMLIDLDGFKAVNDTAGHIKGDRILQRFAEVAKAQLRGYDAIFRYGGDEFVLLLQDADEESAQHIFSRIRQGIQQDELLQTHNIGCSAGAVVLNQQANESALLARADTALYEAKLSGKDRLCIAA